MHWVSPLEDLGANLRMMIIPGFCLGTVSAAVIMRMTRSSMLDVLGQDYIRTGRAKGLSHWVVIARHALKNALIPVVTVAGLQVGWLLGGSVVVEEVFTLPGVGRLVLWAISFNAIFASDYPVVVTITLIGATIVLFTNLATDIVYTWLDPRIRYD